MLKLLDFQYNKKAIVRGGRGQEVAPNIIFTEHKGERIFYKAGL